MSHPTGRKRKKVELFLMFRFLKSATLNSQSAIAWALLFFFLSITLLAPGSSQPRSPVPEDSLLFKEAEALFSKGEIERALWRFRQLTVEYPKSPLFHDARLGMAICYTQLKRPKDAIQTLNNLLPAFSAPARMIQVFTLLGENHLELKDPINTLLWYGKALLLPGTHHDELKKKTRSIIDAFDSEEQLNEVEATFRGAYAGGYAKFKLAQMASKSGHELIAKKMFSELEIEYPAMDVTARVKKPSETIPAPVKSKYSVGVLLPLGGIHKPFGEKALQGIQLAMKEKEARDKSPLVSLVIRDSRGNPVEAEKAMEEMAKGEKVIAIIGPLLSLNIDRTARKAQQLRIPLISLSQKEPITGQGNVVFQNSLTPLDQVQRLVSFAVKEMELRTFAIFYPNSPYGSHFKDLFQREVARMGGRILGTVVYQEEQTDFRQEIRGFFKVETLPRQGDPRKKEEEFKQGLSVDGLFIPDTHERVGLILSQMSYYDIRGTTFLGTNAWNGPGLVSMAGKQAEEAIFVDAFSKTPAVKSFIAEFQKEYLRQPETLEAISYDGARLLREILQSKSPRTPAELNEELRKIHSFLGVSGLRGFREDGKAIRTLSILRVKNSRIEHFSP